MDLGMHKKEARWLALRGLGVSIERAVGGERDTCLSKKLPAPPVQTGPVCEIFRRFEAG